MKLLSAGELNTTLMSLVKAIPARRSPTRVTSTPCSAAVRSAVGVSHEMIREFEIEDLRALSEHIIDTSERASTAAVRGVPEGVYYYEMAVDGY